MLRTIAAIALIFSLAGCDGESSVVSNEYESVASDATYKIRLRVHGDRVDSQRLIVTRDGQRLVTSLVQQCAVFDSRNFECHGQLYSLRMEDGELIEETVGQIRRYKKRIKLFGISVT